MKRRQRRFTSEAQIIEAIDAKKAECVELLARSIELTQSGVLEYMERAKVLDKRRARINDTMLPKLKNALAEFRTELLPITTDKGVVIK